MVEIEILYSDETRQRVSAAQAATLVLTDVLFVFIHSAVQRAEAAA